MSGEILITKNHGRSKNFREGKVINVSEKMIRKTDLRTQLNKKLWKITQLFLENKI